MSGAILAGTLSMALAAAQQGATITVQTNMTEYKSGDTILISGKVQPVVSGEQVIIRVLSPMGALTRIDPVNVTADGSYSYSYVIAGPLNLNSGDYRVAATYLGLTRESTFRFTSLEPYWQTYILNVGGRNYEIQYSILGGRVQTIASDFALATTTVGITTDSNGRLLLRLPIVLAYPGTLHGSNTGIPGSSPTELIVFADGIEAVVETTFMACQVQAALEFDAGTEEIELVSTWWPAELDMELSPEQRSFFTTVSITAEGEEFGLQARLNADSCNFSFTQSERRLHAVLSGQESPGYFEITLPHRFLGGDYAVLLNGVPATDFNMTYNPGQEDSTTIALQYDAETVKSIDIIGATAIPEFGWLAVTILAAFLSGVAFATRLIQHSS
jgi:hypothetical protein